MNAGDQEHVKAIEPRFRHQFTGTKCGSALMTVSLHLSVDSDTEQPAHGPDEMTVAGLLRVAADAARDGNTDDPAVAELVQFAGRLIGSRSSATTLAAAYGLSDRESQVLDLVAHGFSNPQIADSLFVSVSTVTFHLGRTFAKTGVRNRHELTSLMWGRLDTAA